MVLQLTTPLRNFNHTLFQAGVRLRDSISNFSVLLQIREMEVQNVDIVSGSVRYPNGHWNLNCHQMSYKNYAINIKPGYHRSTADSCLLCDFSQGPFLAKTEILEKFNFDSKLKPNIQFIDFFLQVHLPFLFKCSQIK